MGDKKYLYHSSKIDHANGTPAVYRQGRDGWCGVTKMFVIAEDMIYFSFMGEVPKIFDILCTFSSPHSLIIDASLNVYLLVLVMFPYV